MTAPAGSPRQGAPWRTARGFERLVFFSDAVVAIAISLLILPVVDIVTTDETVGVGDLFSDHWGELLAFGLSFAVIAMFWTVHHRLFETVESYTPAMIRVNMFWLATIVFLPLPTEMLAQGSGAESAIYALYIGTILVSSATLDVLTEVIARTPELRTGAPAPSSDVVVTALIAVALVVAVAVPSIGMWSMLLLALQGPLRSAMQRRSRAHPAPVEPPAE